MHKHFVNRLVSVITATTAVMWMSAVAFPSAQTEGVKETGQFVNAGADTSSAVSKARLQVQNTLAAYNALVTQPSKDMKGDFKKLLNGAKDTGERVDDARERVTKMEAAGDTYFAGRAAAIKGIPDTDLREKGQQRLDESKKGYAGRPGVASRGWPVAPESADRSRQSDHVSWQRSDAQCDDLAQTRGAEVQRARGRGSRQGGSGDYDCQQVLGFVAARQTLIVAA